eukprot:1064316-Pelagomonas_calceolata.AAC.1
MRMRTHLHAELIQAISNLLKHCPHPIHFYKVKAHSGINGNEGADACARTCYDEASALLAEILRPMGWTT